MQGNVPRTPHPLPPLPGAPVPVPVPAPVAGAGQPGHQACASCKHQRKKCSENCELAPYFPAERTKEFGLVQKVYGVSNLTKMMKANENVADRVLCAETLTWEAKWRDRDPATGCYNEVIQLRKQNANLRDIIRSLCANLELPLPYSSPVPQPRWYAANGNTCSSSSTRGNNNGGGNLFHEAINNNNGGRNLIHEGININIGGRNLIHEGINNNHGGRILIHEGVNNHIGGGNVVHEGINNNSGNIGGSGGMHAPQQRMNHVINSRNFAMAYHNLQSPPYMIQPGFQGDTGHNEFYP